MSEIIVKTKKELLEELSWDNDRIGDFEPIKWLIDGSDDLVLETISGRIIRFIN